MKIITPGRDQQGYSVEHKCSGHGNGGGGCGAVLLVELADMRYFPGVPGSSWGSRDPAVMFRCCQCNVLTDLPVTKWPINHQRLPHASQFWMYGREE
ncbi:hypothetical protein LAV_00162 [Sphingobium phage Lacusarx]|uniref:Uncharacterized protein n=1 Tax=Sphingobium phage Lacusarx TaxID=1980139 RepID=A0A1W6DWZ4_9CAUD|nr:hypothetical protein FDH44_gp141 [Sphingobium phage Lacusarx]ARK07537.1 hypothetical protein LAV_00162 [Sphingobium phage Lacusarx]